MAKLRERFRVPRLRRLVKKLRGSCNGCKKFQAKPYPVPPPGSLPITRTQGSIPFQVVGVDFAGPIRYQQNPKKEGKAYLALYGCSLTRAVYLDLLSSLQISDFLASLKRFIARRGRPEIIYSDNGSTFKAAAKWLQKVHQDEKCHAFLAENSIKWKFNLSRAPWWAIPRVRWAHCRLPGRVLSMRVKELRTLNNVYLYLYLMHRLRRLREEKWLKRSGMSRRFVSKSGSSVCHFSHSIGSSQLTFWRQRAWRICLPFNITGDTAARGS